MMTRVSGLADVCCELCGNNTLMALGLTIVDVIIKNISSRNMMSVIDDILNCGDILFLRFSISLFQINGKILDERLHLVSYPVNPCNQIVVGKQCYNTYNKTTNSGNHCLIYTARKQ